MKIKSNKVKCLKCGEIIESLHRHDFKWCSCRNIAVDGGHSYLKRCGNLDDNSYEELSESEEEKIDELSDDTI